MQVLSNEVSTKVSEAFNFTVDKFPLSGPDGMRTPWYALFRSDTESVVGNGSVTSRYVPHQTDDVLALKSFERKMMDYLTEDNHSIEQGLVFTEK